jgi:hypothetical protein
VLQAEALWRAALVTIGAFASHRHAGAFTPASATTATTTATATRAALLAIRAGRGALGRWGAGHGNSRCGISRCSHCLGAFSTLRARRLVLGPGLLLRVFPTRTLLAGGFALCARLAIFLRTLAVTVLALLLALGAVALALRAPRVAIAVLSALTALTAVTVATAPIAAAVTAATAPLIPLMAIVATRGLGGLGFFSGLRGSAIAKQ